MTTKRSAGAVAARFEVKALDDATRTFSGLASTWDLDYGGDVIKRGAFADTLKEWRASGQAMPLLDSHNGFSSVRAIVGKMTDASETKEGLEATFEVLDGPDGDEIWRRIKGGLVSGLSIGYEPKEVETPDPDQERQGIWRILKKVILREVSVVIWPMNTDARIRSVKSLVDSGLEGLCPEVLTDDDRKDLRCITGRIGSLLRPPAPPEEGAPVAQEKAETPKDSEGTEPKAPPDPPSADVPKAEAEPLYLYDEALARRISGVRTRQVRLNIQSPD